MDVSEKNT